MSISSALSNARSGLAANARAVNVVSSNLANIGTVDYGRRDVELVADRYGTTGGVRVAAITRHVDAGLLGDLRTADAGLAEARTRAGFIGAVQDLVGTPGEAGSLSARIAAFESSLVTAAARPEANDRLQAVSLRAGELAGAIRDVSDGIQSRRQDAEGAIAQAVETLNTDLARVQDINRQITDARQRGFDPSSLLDQRQVVVNRIAELVPVREVPRDNGAIALMTPRGAILIDATVATLEFQRSNVIAPHMTLANGLLGGLTINGQQVDPAGSRSPVSGGRLSALFEVRDTLAEEAQAQIDALARDLIDRFQDPGVDATLAPGDPGLFTDAGAAFAPTDEVGIAGRMTLNTAVDTRVGGDPWRLRDGINAPTPGPVGDAALLNGMVMAISDRRPMASGGLGTASGGLASHMTGFASHLGQARLTEDEAVAFAGTRAGELQARLLEGGVDSDAETQRLLLIEQAYGANARMIQTLDEMMQTLLRI